MRTVLSVPNDFNFRNAVCSHGFFVLAPNRWDGDTQTLHTVLTLDRTMAIEVSIREERGSGLLLRTQSRLRARHEGEVQHAVSRMLRLGEDFTAFHTRCRKSASHHTAAKTRFGRLLRSASLFEDVIKVICTCNVAWRQTVAMIDNIVAHWGVPTDRGTARGFPTPALLAAVDAEELRTRSRVGYRAAYIHAVAAGVAEGTIDLARFEQWTGSTDELWAALKELPGIGAYGAANLLMLLGRYDRLAIDTETLRFLRTRYPRRTWTPAAIQKHYASWTPHQFLAYWFELWQDYVDRHGRADQWTHSQTGSRITEPPSSSRKNRRTHHSQP